MTRSARVVCSVLLCAAGVLVSALGHAETKVEYCSEYARIEAERAVKESKGDPMAECMGADWYEKDRSDAARAVLQAEVDYCGTYSDLEWAKANALGVGEPQLDAVWEDAAGECLDGGWYGFDAAMIADPWSEP